MVKGRGRCKQGGQRSEEDEKVSVGRVCIGVLGSLRWGECPYDLGPTIIATAGTAD